MKGHPEILDFHELIEQSSVTLEEIENLHEFVHKLEKIELPNQMVAAIGDPLLQRFLQLKPTSSNFRRIDEWLLAFFEDQLENLEHEKAIQEMLEAIRNYTCHTKVRFQILSQMILTCLSIAICLSEVSAVHAGNMEWHHKSSCNS